MIANSCKLSLRSYLSTILFGTPSLAPLIANTVTNPNLFRVPAWLYCHRAGPPRYVLERSSARLTGATAPSSRAVPRKPCVGGSINYGKRVAQDQEVRSPSEVGFVRTLHQRL